MRRVVGVLVAVLFVALMATEVLAQPKVYFDGGLFRFRGFWLDNPDYVDATKDSDRWMEFRIRWRINADIAPGVALKTRWRTIGDVTGSSNPVWNNAADTDAKLQLDYGYLQWKTPYGILFVGRQVAGWGNKLLIWDARRDRIKFVTKVSGATLVLFTDKRAETRATDDLNDWDAYAAAVVTKVSGFKTGLVFVYFKDDRTGGFENGIILDAFFKGNVDPVKLEGEFAYETGDFWENLRGAGASPMALFVKASFNAGQLTPSLLVAYASDGWKSDDDFRPLTLVGTANPLGKVGGDFAAGVDDSAYLIALGTGFKVNDKLSLYGRIGYIEASTENDDTEFQEIDAGLKYLIAKGKGYKFTYSIDFGYLIVPDNAAAGWDSNAFGLGHALVASF